MIRYFLLSVSLMSVLSVFCQEKGGVSGGVLEENKQKPLGGATIIIFRSKDSSRIGATVSAADGSFQLVKLPLYDSLILEISYAGMEGSRTSLIIKEKNTKIPPILLHPLSQQLQTAEVMAERPLMQIKGDTTEFKARDFKTAPNSMARDLIRRLPGLTVDVNGRLFFNGQPVKTILVDGRPFFSSDGGIALNNIPVELIDKIQLADTKTREEELTGRPAASREKTLNIKMKPGNNQFCNLGASAGTGGRYEASLMGSQTNNNRRLSVFGGSNNINKDDIDGVGPLVYSPSGGGVTKAIYGGAEYSLPLCGEVNLITSYKVFFPTNTVETVQKSQEQIRPDSSLYNSASANGIDKSSLHSFYFGIYRERDLNLGVSVNEKPINKYNQTTQVMKNEAGAIINGLSGEDISKGDNLQVDNVISYSKKLNDKGRLLFLSGNTGYVQETLHDLNIATTDLYEHNIDSQSVLRQAIDNLNRSRTIGAEIKYIEPLDKVLSVQVGEIFSGSWSTLTKNTWALDANDKKIAIDSLYSNSFRSTMINNTVNTTFYFNKNGFNLSGGAQIITTYQLRSDLTHAVSETNRQTRLTPFATLAYKSAKHEQVEVWYAANYSNPTLQELQPVADNSNPLSIKIGNPNLRLPMNQTVSLRFSQANPNKKVVSTNASVELITVENKVGNHVSYDSLGRQTTRYVNINGTYEGRQEMGINLLFRKGDRSISIQPGERADLQQDKLFLNEVLTGVRTLVLNPKVSFMYNKGAGIAAMLVWSPTFNEVVYQRNAAPRQLYTVQDLYGVLNLFLFKQMKWANLIMYTYNNGLAAGISRSSVVWNMNFSYLVLKNKVGEIKLSAFDLLHQNRNISRTVAANTITDSQINNLQQYFLFGFVYHFHRGE